MPGRGNADLQELPRYMTEGDLKERIFDYLKENLNIRRTGQNEISVLLGKSVISTARIN